MSSEKEQAYWQAVVDYRTRRFSKLVALKAPSYVLCSDFELLARAVAALHPEAFGQVLAEQRRKESRREHGLCVFCGVENHARNASGEDWCDACEAEARADAEESDAEDGESNA